MRKLVVTIFSLVLIFSSTFGIRDVKAEAHILNKYEYLATHSLDEIDAKLSTLSVPELQNIVKELTSYAQMKDSGITTQLQKTAWLAAAKIARSVGYPLSATLVEYSVRGDSYYEHDGQFARSIRQTDVYNYMLQHKNGQAEFNSGDLYYSIHGFNFDTNIYTNPSRLFIYDEFDFKYGAATKSLFSSIVNNFAALEQYHGVLSPISVRISFAMRDKYNPKHDLAELPANMQAELLFKHYIADSDRFYVYALTGELDAEDKSSWQPANWQANDKAFSEALSWTKSFVYTYIKEKEFSGKLSDLLLNAQFDKQLMYRTIAKHKLYIYYPATKSGYLFVYTPH